MVFRRRKFKRQRRKFFRRRRPVRRLFKRVRKIENRIETKKLDGIHTTSALTPTPTLYYFPLIPQGTGTSERIGAEIVAKTLELRLYVRRVAQNDTGGDFHLFRFVLFWYKRPTGALTDSTQIVNIPSVPITNSDQVISQRNWFHRDKFRVIKDKVWVINPHLYYNSNAPSIQAESVAIQKKWHIKLKNHKIKWSDTAGAAASCTMNALYAVIYYYGNDGTYPAVVMNWRLKYKDA